MHLTFPAPNQATEWKDFYIRAVDFLEALNNHTEVKDHKKDGKS